MLLFTTKANQQSARVSLTYQQYELSGQGSRLTDRFCAPLVDQNVVTPTVFRLIRA